MLEAMSLFGECGFDFLPETDLQKRPGLEVVMTVGLHLCALEMTDQQLDTLACIALAGQLPEFFPFKQWISAVKKSFLSQEVDSSLGQPTLHGCELFNHLWDSLSCMALSFSIISGTAYPAWL